MDIVFTVNKHQNTYIAVKDLMRLTCYKRDPKVEINVVNSFMLSFESCSVSCSVLIYLQLIQYIQSNTTY